MLCKTQKYYSVVLLVIWQLFSCYQLVSQIGFGHLTQADGLSNKNINCIIQDHNGFMWFGTNDGLNKFDGYEFTIFRTSPKDSNSISSNYITCIFEDAKNVLWLGTKGGGLNSFNLKTERFTRYVYNAGDKNSLSSNDVLAIYYENPEQMWIGTDGGGLNLFNTVTKKFFHYTSSNLGNSISSNEIISINGNNNGNIFIGTWNGGLNYFDSKKSTFSLLNDASGNPLKHVWTLKLENSNMLIGTFGYGLFSYNISGNNLLSVKLNLVQEAGDNVIWAIFIDSLKNKWIGTNNGLYKIESKTNTILHYKHSEFEKTSLLSNKITSISQSSSGIMWIGTENGINYLNPNTKKFQKNISIKEFENNSVYTVVQGKSNNLWVGTEKYGICNVGFSKNSKILNANLARVEAIKTEGKINTILEDANGSVWVGTRYGLVSYNLKNRMPKTFVFDSNDFQNSSNDVLAICETATPYEYWVGTDNGLYFCNFKTENFKKYSFDNNDSLSINSNHVLTIYSDKRHIIWVSTWKGLNRYNAETDNFTRINKPEIANLYINSIHDDSRGNLWLGTRNGLYKYNIESQKTLTYLEDDGLCNNNVCSIVDDLSGNLWLSTTKGLSKFNLNTGMFNCFDAFDGLLNSTFNTNSGCMLNNGLLIFGGTNGLDAFVAADIKINAGQMPVVFNDFRIFNIPVTIGAPDSLLHKSISETKNITLTAKDEVFSIGFVALNFVNSNKCKYAYMLEGFEKEWVQIGSERKATYTNLNAGDYIFKVKAANEDGIWSDKVATMHIKILPPWWKSIWFKILVVVTMFLIFFAYYQNRVYQYHKRNRLLEKTIEERLKEIKKQKEELSAQAKMLSDSNSLLNNQKEEIERQAGEITRMNDLLRIRNENLEENVVELSKARVMNTSVTFDEFQHIYPDDDSCKKLIYELKLKTGFVCPTCKSTEFQEGTIAYSRRCKHCGYIESVTVGTIFFHLKFPIVKAFYILYLVTTNHKLTVDQLSSLITLRRETCWAFKNKIEEYMKIQKRFKNPSEGWKELIITRKNG